MRIAIFIFLAALATTLVAQDQEPTDRHFWYSMETEAPSESIWKVWTDVANWKAWDTGLRDALLEGSFLLGAKGQIISLEKRKSSFKVIEYVDGQSYTYKTKLPLGSLYVKRYLKQEGRKTIFTHEIWFKGLTGKLFAKMFGAKFRAMLPDVLTNVRRLAENG